MQLHPASCDFVGLNHPGPYQQYLVIYTVHTVIAVQLALVFILIVGYKLLAGYVVYKQTCSVSQRDETLVVEAHCPTIYLPLPNKDYFVFRVSSKG